MSEPHNLAPPNLSLPLVADPPDGVRSIVGHKKRSVSRHRHSDRPSPDVGVRGNETRKEVFVFAGGFAIAMERNTNDFIPGARRAVPGPVLRGKDIALVLLRELVAFVEGHLERCVVR